MQARDQRPQRKIRKNASCGICRCRSANCTWRRSVPALRPNGATVPIACGKRPCGCWARCCSSSLPSAASGPPRRCNRPWRISPGLAHCGGGRWCKKCCRRWRTLGDAQAGQITALLLGEVRADLPACQGFGRTARHNSDQQPPAEGSVRIASLFDALTEYGTMLGKGRRREPNERRLWNKSALPCSPR